MAQLGENQAVKWQICCLEHQSFPDGGAYNKFCCIGCGPSRAKDFWRESDITNFRFCCSGYQRRTLPPGFRSAGGPVTEMYAAPTQQQMQATGVATGYPAPKKV